ncbi:FtsX-like permease family protein [Streptantibioticus silvisoli]|uniref:ABC transporter permease n=1 Tax=Streptantibioticus silvisoli TaxID=2705255 RepID=A0ABT6W2U8_9ACTN|nr:FtsX-like permease family protein [Streptantibioticus silvisoli]MDI5964008.1 ABC transporter permease [Streptantibioticus silvisoli]
MSTSGNPARVWARDLAFGVRFAVGGGREGWARTLLTAVGVGLGVAMLLLAASVPAAFQSRSVREDQRVASYSDATHAGPGPHTLLARDAATTFRGNGITGELVRPDGPSPALPPGLSRLPGTGEMAVSPALHALLDAPGSALLRERLPYRTVATIGAAGLSGPRDLYYYAGDPQLTTLNDNAARIDHFGASSSEQPLDPVLILLVVVAVVVLLVPVGVFIGAAVRFGGERRDRRLAALRLVGADRRMVCRIAAGEAAFGSLLGLAVGAALFLGVRQLASDVTLYGLSFFPSDLRPETALTVLIAVAVPLSAIAVTLLALRGVAIEPLGVVRNAAPRRRRLLWRLAMPLAGAALLYPKAGRGGVSDTVGEIQVGAGAALLLVGLTALLPWLVEATVRRLGGAGSVPWQLACRRLQLTPGSAARMVSGITVAVAGAIAVMTLMSGVGTQYTRPTGQNTAQAQMAAYIDLPKGTDPGAVVSAFRGTPGVTGVRSATTAVAATVPALARARAVFARKHDPDVFADVPQISLTVAGCPQLEAYTGEHGCRPGSVYLIGEGDSGQPVVRPGETIDLAVPDPAATSAGSARPWTVPATARTGTAHVDATGAQHTGVLATPQALSTAALADPQVQISLTLAPGVADAPDQVRNTAVRFDPSDPTVMLSATDTSGPFSGIRRAVLAGATVVLALIGASLLVSTLEQLRDRRRLLAVLVAFGTRRGTLGASVLWQTAVPVVLGLALAVAGGLSLGALLRAISHTPGGYDWSGIGTLTGIAAGVVLVVTLASLPPLWRMMRPEGLRTE